MNFVYIIKYFYILFSSYILSLYSSNQDIMLGLVLYKNEYVSIFIYFLFICIIYRFNIIYWYYWLSKFMDFFDI